MAEMLYQRRTFGLCFIKNANIQNHYVFKCRESKKWVIECEDKEPSWNQAMVIYFPQRFTIPIVGCQD